MTNIQCVVLLNKQSLIVNFYTIQSEFADTAAFEEVKKSLEVSHKDPTQYFHIIQCM